MYVKHCPVTCGHRREPLEKHFSERGIHDVTWITGFPADDPYVQWFQKRLDIKSGVRFTSGLVKTYESLKMFVESGKPSAIFVDDDVVFIKNWDKYPLPPLPFVNLSVGVNFSIIPDGNLRGIGNNGGCEAVYMTREFAQLLLDNVDARQTIDIVIHAMVNYSGFPLACVPVAQQTSLLEPATSSFIGDTSREELTHWINFVNDFKPTGVRYEDLYNEYFHLWDSA